MNQVLPMKSRPQSGSAGPALIEEQENGSELAPLKGGTPADGHPRTTAARRASADDGPVRGGQLTDMMIGVDLAPEHRANRYVPVC